MTFSHLIWLANPYSSFPLYFFNSQLYFYLLCQVLPDHLLPATQVSKVLPISPWHPLCTSGPALTLALEFLVHSAFLFPSTGPVFAYPVPAKCPAPQRGLINVCVTNWGSFQHRGSRNLERGVNEVLSHASGHGQRGRTSLLPGDLWSISKDSKPPHFLSPLFSFTLKKEHQGFASQPPSTVTGRQNCVWNRKNHTLSYESNP